MNRLTLCTQLASQGLARRLRYRHGFPFITSIGLAVVTGALPRFGGPTSIWTFALLALIATSFTLLCGGRFRTFYIVIAVMPPFLFSFEWLLRIRWVMPDFPTKAVGEYFLYFVAAPILVVWLGATLLNRRERHA